MNLNITTLEEFKKIVSEHRLVLALFGNQGCAACSALKPKVSELVTSKFPQLVGLYINTSTAPEIYGQYTIFTVPTVVVFVDGSETIRFSRSFSIKELESRLVRIYDQIG